MLFSKNVFGLKVKKKKKKKAGKALVFANKGFQGMASKAHTKSCKDAELFMGINLINHILIFLDDSEIKSAAEEPPGAELEVPELGSEPGPSAYLSFREVINTKRCMIFTYLLNLICGLQRVYLLSVLFFVLIDPSLWPKFWKVKANHRLFR